MIRPLLALVLCLAPASAALAQQADTAAIAAQREAMKKLAWMRGTWQGPATIMGPGGFKKITQTERIGSFLGGTLVVMEGKGFEADGSPGFNAFGILSYNAAKQAYALTSFAQGRAGTFTLTPNDTGYVWEIPAGPATIRYTATLKDGTWTEIGERVMPGQPPVKFFEMNLRRTGDTDWPAAGALTPKP